MSNETWLVTGAAGFIGTNVIKQLLSSGSAVVGIDNFSTGHPENIALFSGNPLFRFIEADITDPLFESLFMDIKPTHVLHLAAMVSIQACEAFQDRAYAVNVQAFKDLLHYAKRTKVRHVMYASSSAVYGFTQAGAISERTPVAPISIYGETKVANEHDAQAICGDGTMSVTGFRFFNLFGPYQSDASAYAAVIPLWAGIISRGECPIIYGDGTATRDFCHIDNVVQAIIKVRDAAIPGARLYNVGTGVAITLNALFTMISEILGKHPEPSYQPWRLADIVHSLADISLIERECGYTPTVFVEEGLKRLLNCADGV